MKPRDSHSNPPWSEADVERLLTDFFRAEMPAELRQSTSIAPHSIATTTNRERRAAGFKGLGAAACALLLAATALSPTGRKLVSPAKETREQPSFAVKATTPTETVVADRQPAPTLPPEILNILPPELQSPAENSVWAFDGDGDGLDLRDLLRIEVFEPRESSKPPRRIPEQRPRLPEER